MKARRNDYWIMLGSLFMAVLLWVYVTGVQAAPERNVSVKLSPVGLSPSLVATGLPDQVDVRIQDQFDLNLYSGQAFAAVVDLSGAKAGNDTVPVQVTSPFGVKVVQVIPAQVTVAVDRMADRHLPVQVKVQGNAAPGYRAGAPVARPVLVDVRGPATALDQLSTVPVTVDLGGASQPLDESLPVELSGSGFTVAPDRVRVTVPVVQESPVKSVPVVVQVEGVPASGYQIGNITANPDTVTLYGSPQQLAGVTFINTLPVSLGNYTHDLLEEVPLQLPAGVGRVAPDKVQVTVQVNPVGAGSQPGAGTQPDAGSQPAQ
ncbi:MAG TPA: CdaR family protein [Spirochaetia bacterium]|nr:CdaR family protein [Spirochaetia bacterium]